MRLKNKTPRIIIFSVLACLFTLGTSLALDDGFGISQKIEGQHFSIYCSPGIDAVALAQQLNIRPIDQLLSGKTTGQLNLAAMLDILFKQVCDILDMQLYSFHGSIKICVDYQKLKQLYHNLFHKDLGGRRSFYVYDLNCVYVSAEDFRREIVGHEIAHAIISHYFVVLPSIRIQEVLSAYVEYQLRKSAN